MNLNAKIDLSALFKARKDAGHRKLAYSWPSMAAWVAVLMVAGISGWIAYRTVVLTMDASFADPGAKPPQPVLVNTQGFQQALERTKKAQELKPTTKPVFDPFKTPAVDAREQR